MIGIVLNFVMIHLKNYCGQKKLKVLMKSTFGGSY